MNGDHIFRSPTERPVGENRGVELQRVLARRSAASQPAADRLHLVTEVRCAALQLREEDRGQKENRQQPSPLGWCRRAVERKRKERNRRFRQHARRQYFESASLSR